MTFGFFFGLIAASIVRRSGDCMAAYVFAPIAFGTCLGCWPPSSSRSTPRTLPGSSFSAAWQPSPPCWCPAFPGSFVLLILGKYTDAIDALGRLDMSFLLPLAGGVVTGALIFSRAISWLLERFYRRTMLTVIGVLCGSLLAVWPFKDRRYEMIHGKAKLVSADPFVPVNIDGTVVTGVVAILSRASRSTAFSTGSRSCRMKADAHEARRMPQ